MQHHIMIGDQPWCAWLGCKAGQDISAKAGRVTCGHRSGRSAKRAAQALRPFFKRGVVRVFPGACTAA